MSRIGRKPIPLPANIQVDIQGSSVVKGRTATSSNDSSGGLSEKGKIRSSSPFRTRTRNQGATRLHGLDRNMVTGVSRGLKKSGHRRRRSLRANWPGGRPRFTWDILTRSSLISLRIDAEDRKTRIHLRGIDKELLEGPRPIAAFQEAEPYKGKGIKYADEVIRQKGR